MATITIHTGTYAPWGSIPGEAHPPEKTEEERQREAAADRAPLPAVLKEMGGWAWPDLELAMGRYNFPRPAGRTLTKWGSKNDGAAFWSRKAMARWREEFKGFANKVK